MNDERKELLRDLVLWILLITVLAIPIVIITILFAPR